MDVSDMLASSPTTIPNAAQYRLVDDLVAGHDAKAAPPHAAVLEAGRIVIVPVTSVEAVQAATIGPVYRRHPGGDLVVPTGRILVRFGEGDSAERHRDQLRAAGYEIDQVLSYASHAAWVRAADGGISGSLRHLARLQELAGVHNVEPQLISTRQHRTDLAE